MTQPEIIAHRGATYLAPENTLSAFQNAIDLGADGVEMDVQQTKDQGLIIHHDYLIDIGTEISAKIYDLTMGELENIDLTKWNGVDLTTEKLASLEEALTFCKGLGDCRIQLELKAPILNDPDFVSRVVDQIRASGLGDRLILVSFRHDLLKTAKELMPELRVGILTLGNLLSTMLPPPVIWKDLGLVNSMEEPLDEENCPCSEAAGRSDLQRHLGQADPHRRPLPADVGAADHLDPLRSGRPRRLCSDPGFSGGLCQL